MWPWFLHYFHSNSCTLFANLVLLLQPLFVVFSFRSCHCLYSISVCFMQNSSREGWLVWRTHISALLLSSGLTYGWMALDQISFPCPLSCCKNDWDLCSAFQGKKYSELFKNLLLKYIYVCIYIHTYVFQIYKISNIYFKYTYLKYIKFIYKCTIVLYYNTS